MSELPLCEVSLACDNLLCDGHGRPPNPTLVVDVYMASTKVWVQYARTEIIEVIKRWRKGRCLFIFNSVFREAVIQAFLVQ